jgi:putative membrane protein
MKTNSIRRLLVISALFITPSVFAANEAPAATWHAQSLGQAIAYLLLFTAIGIAAAIVGYKVFDKCTPGNLNKEIVEHKNVAAAIVAAAVILGVCIIIAAAMVG